MKKFDDIKKEIALLDDAQIEKYVDDRLQELENSAEDITIGQGYTDSYDGYIGIKTHYKPMASTDKIKSPDLVYDYNEPYINIIKAIKGKNINELLIMNDIFFTINSFSDLGSTLEFSRGFVYLSAIQSGNRVSIKDIFDNDCAFCSERSGLVQNIFKFLGIDSELITGYIDNEPHAYNIVYPNGYGNEPMFLFDVSHFVNFNSNEQKYSLAYFYGMNKAKYNELISGRQYQVELSKTESYYRNVYGFDNNYEFVAREPKYTYGLENNPNIVNKQVEDNWLYNAHYENGVESVTKNL